MRRIATLVLLALTLVLVADQAAAEPPAATTEAGGDRVRALIANVVEHQRALTTLRAHFVQTKSSSLLLAPSRSSGTFSFRAPDSVRWDFADPEPMVVLFAGETLTTYHPTRSVAQQVKLSRRHKRFVRVLAGTQPLDDLASQFRITLSDPGKDAPYRLTLEPIQTIVKRKLASVVLEIDRKLLLPVVVAYNEQDGDSTRYELRDLELNPHIEESLFTLELGDDVVVETVDASAGMG